MTKKRTEKERAKPPQFKRIKRKPCLFCVEKKMVIDYKDVNLLRRFMTDRGKIASPRRSGCCTLHQRRVAKAIKHARQLGLLPYLVD